MKRGPKQPGPTKLSKAVLAAILLGLLAFSMLMGVTAVAMGFGSMYPEINLIASPVACRGSHLDYSKQVTRVGSATYYTATWSCTNDATGEKSPVDPNYVYFSAGAVYGLGIFALLVGILVLYWNSSIGPAKNGGPKLW